jgi:hypothetical protein
MVERNISLSTYARDSSGSRQSMNVNLLRVTQKPKISLDGNNKSNMKELINTPNKRFSEI